jgi:transcriptional regulator with XRE-family HTH domain
MPQVTNLNKKELAKSLYMNGNFTQEEIAEKVCVARQTVARWMKAENWEELKASITISPAQILAGLNRQIVEINNNINDREPGQRFASVQEADTLVKLAAAIKKIETDAGIAEVVAVGIRFTNWLRQTDVEKAKEVSNMYDSFIKSQLN